LRAIGATERTGGTHLAKQQAYSTKKGEGSRRRDAKKRKRRAVPGRVIKWILKKKDKTGNAKQKGAEVSGKGELKLGERETKIYSNGSKKKRGPRATHGKDNSS